MDPKRNGRKISCHHLEVSWDSTFVFILMIYWPLISDFHPYEHDEEYSDILISFLRTFGEKGNKREIPHLHTDSVKPYFLPYSHQVNAH